MSFASHHRIIGVKLITMDDQELEPTADVEWSLDIWRADGMQTTGDRTIGAGSLVERGDADLRDSYAAKLVNRSQQRSLGT